MSAEREMPAEDSTKIVRSFRPLNDRKERSGSKIVVKFPNSAEKNCLSIGINLSVHEEEDVFEVIEEGKSNRHIAVTNMNEHSSRSHSVLLINVKQENLENQKLMEASTRNLELEAVAAGPMPATPAAGLMLGSISSDERARLEAERERLYQKLDEKDEQSQYVKNLKEQIVEQEKLIASARREYEALQSEMARTQQENESAKKNVNEVLQALVKLAFNYDQKSQEINTKNKDMDSFNEELQQKQALLNTTTTELQKFLDMSSHQKKRINEKLSNLLRDLAEVGQALSLADSPIDMKMNSIPSASAGDIGNVEEDLTMARLYISKMKTEAKNIVQRCTNLETQKIDSNKKLSEYERDLGEYRLIISQHEANMKSLLQQSMREAENKKRSLEEQIDSLREECAKLKAAKHVSAVNAEEKQKAEELRAMFDSQMDELREAHTKQVSELRDEIIAKQHEMAEMKDLHQKLILAHQQMAADYEKLKQEEAEKSNKLQEIILTNERREQARNDLKGLEDKVAKELQTLHNLRKLFVQNLQAYIKKTVLNEDSEEDGGSLAQKQTISFLEKNLDQLTEVHKQLVRENGDLRCELLKLETRLRTTMERVKALETALIEAKEGAKRDRKRYQYEVDRIKEAVRQKHLGQRGPQAQIAKPIRAGQGAIAIRGGGAAANPTQMPQESAVRKMI
ncbi:kinesin heavy chain-like [Musca vetustissima]|uniref:kinesin heavy chain-like n=1 Tax=Musca vetustissima TaxID=27455 RepID=UPI002AB7EAD5|nr:kinesin heavy chain-like [Musca vetustissima]